MSVSSGTNEDPHMYDEEIRVNSERLEIASKSNSFSAASPVIYETGNAIEEVWLKTRSCFYTLIMLTGTPRVITTHF